jgi:hypothetical protein
MPTSSSYFSSGYKGKKKKPEPPRQSGATSGDLSIPGYEGETPTVYAPASVSGLVSDTDPSTAVIGSTPHEYDPRAIAAAIIAGDVTPKNEIISGLLDAPVPSVDKKQAVSRLTKLAGKLNELDDPELGNLGPAESHVADTVLDVGKDEHASKRDLLAAAETGLVESGFKNLKYGDSDSRGWRQERSSLYPNPNNVEAGAERFFDELKTDSGAPDAPTAGLAAQAAQGSEFPERYDERKQEGWDIVKDYLDGSDQPHPKLEGKLTQAKKEARAAGVSQGKIADIVDDTPDPQTETVKVRADAKGMVQWADHLVGTQEGTPKQVSWADHFGLGNGPWCANFVSNGLVRRGFKDLPSNPNYVPAYEEWANEGKAATNIGTDFSQAKPGDLVTFSGQHIGLYVGNGEMVSGNFGDEVARSMVTDDSSPVSMIIRPHYHGGTVQMPVGAANQPWSAGEVTSEGAISPGSSESPLVQAAMERVGSGGPMAPSSSSGPNRGEMIMDLLNAPTPSVSDPTSVLEDDEDELMKLIMRRLGSGAR